MKKYLLPIIYTAFFISACETEVNPDLGKSLDILVVDAWLTNNDTIQHINITRSQPYFNRSKPAKVPEATVIVTDLNNNQKYVFEERTERYTWESPDGTYFGEIGHKYTLTVELDGNIYRSATTLADVPPIDSIAFRLEEGNAFFDNQIYGEFFATDLEGVNDTYWIKAWKNGRYLGIPDEINIAYDAAFSANANNDGIQFIQPIRDLISPQEENKDGDVLSPYNLPQAFAIDGENVLNKDGSVYGTIKDNTLLFEGVKVPKDFVSVSLDDDQYSVRNDSLFVKGDSVYVEIHSISNSAYFFMTQVDIELNREGGFGALFATPLANVSTNIISDNAEKTVVGFFNVAAVSSKGKRLVSEDQIRTTK